MSNKFCSSQTMTSKKNDEKDMVFNLFNYYFADLYFCNTVCILEHYDMILNKIPRND